MWRKYIAEKYTDHGNNFFGEFSLNLKSLAKPIVPIESITE